MNTETEKLFQAQCFATAVRKRYQDGFTAQWPDTLALIDFIATLQPGSRDDKHDELLAAATALADQAGVNLEVTRDGDLWPRLRRAIYAIKGAQAQTK